MNNIRRESERLSEAVSAHVGPPPAETLMNDVERAIAVPNILRHHRYLIFESTPYGSSPIEHLDFVYARFRNGGLLTKPSPSGQFVEVTSAQRLQAHEPSPAVTFNRRSVAVFRLDCTH
jgi:hypothetical protein